MTREIEPKRLINLVVTDEFKAKLDRNAQALQISKSDFIRMSVLEKIKRLESA